MENKIARLTATFRTTAAFGQKYAADFPSLSVGGQQFALVGAAVPQTETLAGAQVSDKGSVHAGVSTKAVGRYHLHDDLHRIADAAHSLAMLGTPGLKGKFLMPRSGGDQALIDSGHAFETDAAAFSAQLIGLGLPDDFIAQLGTDIADLETAITAKGTAVDALVGATGGLGDTASKAAIALHVLKTIVPNKYKSDPAKLAEWASASHVEKHTPVPRKKPAAAAQK